MYLYLTEELKYSNTTNTEIERYERLSIIRYATVIHKLMHS